MKPWTILLFVLVAGFGVAQDSEVVTGQEPVVTQSAPAETAPTVEATKVADSELGTKQDPTTVAKEQGSPTPVVGGMEVFQLMFALAVVFFLLKFALPKLVSKFGKRISTSVGGAIQIEESASFGGGNLQVVSVRGKTLLLAVSQAGVNCLADLTDSEAKEDDVPAFFELLDKAKESEPTEEVVTRAAVQIEERPVAKANPKVKAYAQQAQAEPEVASDDEISKDLQARLKRLSQLVK